jgi:autoinducer 2-degrading protein
MISLVILVEASPERVDDFVNYLTIEAAASLANEPGCRDFFVSRSVETPNLFTLAEFYDDQAALDAHRLTPHFILFQEQCAELDLVVKKTVVLGDVIHQ